MILFINYSFAGKYDTAKKGHPVDAGLALLSTLGSAEKKKNLLVWEKEQKKINSKHGAVDKKSKLYLLSPPPIGYKSPR